MINIINIAILNVKCKTLSHLLSHRRVQPEEEKFLMELPIKLPMELPMKLPIKIQVILPIKLPVKLQVKLSVTISNKLKKTNLKEKRNFSI